MFGSLKFNKILSYLTNQANYELRYDMDPSNGDSLYVSYKGFRISEEFSQYTITNIGTLDSNEGKMEKKYCSYHMTKNSIVIFHYMSYIILAHISTHPDVLM